MKFVYKLIKVMSQTETEPSPAAAPQVPAAEPEQPIVANIDASQEYIKAQRTENIMKIVFGVIMAIVVIIVVLSIYSVLT
jgi:t-SNARE complex subunit (syntaxin)